MKTCTVPLGPFIILIGFVCLFQFQSANALTPALIRSVGSEGHVLIKTKYKLREERALLYKRRESGQLAYMGEVFWVKDSSDRVGVWKCRVACNFQQAKNDNLGVLLEFGKRAPHVPKPIDKKVIIGEEDVRKLLRDDEWDNWSEDYNSEKTRPIRETEELVKAQKLKRESRFADIDALIDETLLEEEPFKEGVPTSKLSEFDLDKNFETLLNKKQKKATSSITLDVDSTPLDSNLDDVIDAEIFPDELLSEEKVIQEDREKARIEQLGKEYEEEEELLTQALEEERESVVVLKEGRADRVELSENELELKREAQGLTRTERWSDEMDDQEMRRFVTSHGLEKEKERFDFIRGNSIDHEVGISLNSTIPYFAFSRTSEDDNSQSIAYGYELYYEFYGAHLSDALRKWSVEARYRVANNTYDIGGINAYSSESTFGMMFKYYIRNYPTTIGAFQLYGGLGFRSGSAVVSHKNFTDELGYSVATFPEMEGGFEYKYKKFSSSGASHFGVSFFTTVSYGLTSYTGSEIPVAYYDTFTAHDIRWSAGMGLYF